MRQLDGDNVPIFPEGPLFHETLGANQVLGLQPVFQGAALGTTLSFPNEISQFLDVMPVQSFHGNQNTGRNGVGNED